MDIQRITKTGALFLCICLISGVVQAKPLKIGLIMPMSGPFTELGEQIKHGVKLYMSQHGDEVAGRQIELIIKDDTGINPQLAKREAKRLIVQDDIDILAGFGLTPNAFSVAPLATRAKIPMIVMIAATSSITRKSPYIVRTSFTMAQGAVAMAQWAYDNGIHSAYTLVADYAPGRASAEEFQKAFKAMGGKIVGSVRTPVDTADYSPYLQHVKDADPDAMYTFVPPGSSMVALAKGYKSVGLDEAGIRFIGPGDMTDEGSLAAEGDAVLGMITAFHYSSYHDSPENKAYVKAYHDAYPDDRPNFMSVGGYDGMHLIYEVLKKTDGKATGPDFVEAAKGMSWVSPRGPVTIDPDTRDIIQNEYIRKVKRIDGLLQNVEFKTLEHVKDPVKANEN